MQPPQAPKTHTPRGSKILNRLRLRPAPRPSMTPFTLISSTRCSITSWPSMRLRKSHSQLASTMTISSRRVHQPLGNRQPWHRQISRQRVRRVRSMTVWERSANSSALSWVSEHQTSSPSTVTTNRTTRSTRRDSYAVRSGHTCLTIELRHWSQMGRVRIRSLMTQTSFLFVFPVTIPNQHTSSAK